MFFIYSIAGVWAACPWTLVQQLCSIARTVCPLHGFIFRRSVSAWSLYSQVWTTLTALITNFAINTFIYSRVADQQPLQASGRLTGNDETRVVIPFKDQYSANITKTQLKDLSNKLQTTIQPAFVSRKIGQDLKECETKLQLVNQCVVYQFKCNLCGTVIYVGYTRGRLYARVDGHKSTSSSVRKYYTVKWKEPNRLQRPNRPQCL